MKHNMMKALKSLFALFLVSFLILSCDYQEIGAAAFPSQTIYLPAAASDIYLVNDTNNLVTGITLDTLVPSTFRYKVDIDNNKLIIPLSIYRSGVNNKGNITANLVVDNDSLMEVLGASANIDTTGSNVEIIPTSAFSLVPSVTIKNGEESASFNLEIDLDYLAAQKDDLLALGISVSSPDLKTPYNLSIVRIVIDNDFIMPYPKYSYVVSKSDDKSITFTSKTSSYAKSFIWNFDGVAVPTTGNKITQVFDTYKEHTISFTAIGLTGKPVTVSSILYLWQNMSSTYMKNPGNPFLRGDGRTSLVGNLADWTITDNLKTTKSSGVYYGGFVKSQKYGEGTLSAFMDFFSPDAVQNGKIFQSCTLPAGNYRAAFVSCGFTGSNDCNFVVAAGNTLPDANNIENNSNVLGHLFFNKELTEEKEVFFTITSEQKVTIGFIVNTTTPLKGVPNELMINSVGLYK